MNLNLDAGALFIGGEYQGSEVLTDVDDDGATRHRRRRGFDTHMVTEQVVDVRRVIV
jgi:hypothetical protein